jgi:hypothetical protein
VHYSSRINPPTVRGFRLFTIAFSVAALIGFFQVFAAPQTQISVAQAPPSPTDPVLEWNTIAQTSVLAASAPAPQQYRSLSIVHTAIFDAVNAIDRRYTPYAYKAQAPAGTSAPAAVASAAHEVLVRLYPLQQATLDATLRKSLDAIAESPAKSDGIKLGKTVADQLIALRSNDNANTKIDYKAEKTAGVWQPTPPLFLPALLPHWDKVTPFVLKNADQFKIPAPLALNSAEYAKELDEVKRLGGKSSTVRTPDQTASAIWSTVPPAVLWNTTAKAAATAKGNSLLENARLFALLNIGGLDSYIAGYKVKYDHKLWRPVVAIPNADQIGNPALTPDPKWESLIVTPNHPDYISGHTVSAGAEEQILKDFFGKDAVKANIIFPANAGVTRSFTSFSQITNELIEARIWGGVHTRSSDVQGAVLGKQVGNYIFETALLPLKGQKA